MEKLSNEQREFVEQNHGLIYSYAHRKKLNLEEYYGILALALCQAAVLWDKRKSSFSTYVYMKMSSYVNAHIRGAINTKHKLDDSIQTVWLDEDFSSSGSGTTGDASVGEFTISPMIPLADVCEGKIMANEMLSILSEKERKIVIGKQEGLSNAQIGIELGCSAENVRHHLKKVKRKWKRFLVTVN